MSQTIAVQPDASADIQDPLPEGNWLWRRLFSFAVTAVLLWVAWRGVDRLAAAAMLSPTIGIPALLSATKWVIAFAGMMVMFYMVAPSAEQITRMIKTASLLKSGVTFQQKTRVSTPAGEAASESTTGRVGTMPPTEAERPAADDDDDVAPRSRT